MLSNHKFQVCLEEIKEITRVDLCLYSEKGKLIANTFEPEENMESAVCSFAESMAESQMLAGCHFFKVVVENEMEYILLVRASGEESYMIGRLAVCQIRTIALSYREQFDRNNFIQNILLGNMLVVDIYNKAKKLHIDQAKRMVYVIEVHNGHKESMIMELIKNLFMTKTKDFVTELDEKSVILVKDVSDMKTEDDYMDLAKMIVDNIQTEAMVRVRVGFGNCVTELPELTRSYQEAKMALEVGSIFYAQSDVVSYARLGIGRLIYQLPMSLCDMFVKEVFGEKIPDVFDEETMVTIQKFFENNLNISETARQLYIHRNTLVYRLERLEKIIGLDIRKFEDAMTFKIAMMVISHMKHHHYLEMDAGEYTRKEG
ncbi:MAG: PucR family transcriptional regulator [Lachnospiraceae bacterium]